MSLNLSSPDSARSGGWLLKLVGILVFLGGLPLLAGGVQLISLGGSWYYALAGAALILVGILFFLRRKAGVWLFALLYIATIAWALWEVGSLDFWPLVPRIVAPTVLAIIVALITPLFPTNRPSSKAAPLGIAALLALGLAGVGYLAFQPQHLIRNEVAEAPAPQGQAAAEGSASDWRHYGRTPHGTRYAPIDQINRDNVQNLQVAWTFRTGDPADKGAEDQNTPLQVGDTIYHCTAHNIVHALNAETGEVRWKFDPQATSPVWQRCRGVSYYEPPVVAAVQPAEPVPTAPAEPIDPTAPALAAPTIEEPEEQAAPAAPAAPPAPAQCAARIVLTTIDARLIELDAKTGEPCAEFGNAGTVNLREGMGEVKDGFYFQTSAPTVMRDLVLVGGWVWDNREINEPSGAVRAFNARTGELVWAWDLGNPNITRYPPEGESYTRGTPNVWSTPAFDDELGLVYLPTGNATPDFFGAHRSEAAEQYSASVVALDIATGRERWKFQTVHHDIWDYDVPAQPALYDVPDGNGGTQPALIQITKRGQIFMLNRETGEPIATVEERPVPQTGGVPEDWVSKTQPYSTGMPSIGTEPFTEARMWGATPWDQLYCRIEFKKMRYEGEFTPPGTDVSLIMPGYYGGMNWGSASIDEANAMLVVNDIRMPQFVRLIPQAEVEGLSGAAAHDGLSSQTGTPYAAWKNGFMSPLGVPCHQPPYGTISGIDLKTRQLVWQVPAGTLQDSGPLGMKTGLQIPVGMPSLGGPMTTAGGIVFYAGTQDYYLRALDVRTGEELWKARLPVGTQGTPMTYVSPESGRQFVVISAGGSRQSPDRGDYIVAFSLPKQ
ncbi:membrane-bound PQQ-dependent dehydrogenase, glucose/quinate/shikimate family [Rhizobium sp. LC145]|uniref:membrane-bound PQQ-dependent dehydrogenase, glucose/quinate/shikimate family n=1 Tax=Rhizobium sp. LC145 TaxID=1120688 RepID=UPI00062A1D30|nr:membrane-bound PQQ-dependent dehydrogenase, glucose/quinate/shikimate family [Rhizobium sp. LC145]KKX31570.1 glucose dehydrogenase [Rhizobium sp. LC145]TKT66808.1 membrane-bound PQQ-dependent dehydrogenase, glucose/quinate/shikimate family [Rhizobiaceae bacterium LC148]